MTEQIKNDELDINGPNFNANKYLEKVFKECSLREIMDQECEIARDTQTLHSDMQTLVYENYNKFISATETIRKMKNDFKQMEDEMDLLASNMDKITTLSETVNSNLQETRDKIGHLSGVHSLLQRLQFLFKLPATLKARMDEKNYVQATQDYLHAQRVLQQYGNMPALQGIKQDCESLLNQLKQELRKQFADAKASTKELMQSVDLLLQLDEPARELCLEFLNCAEKGLSEQLVLLKDQSEQRDIVEWIDLGCSGFLSDLCLIVGSFNNMFITTRINNMENSEIFENFAAVELETFVITNMQNYFDLVQSKVDSKQDIAADTSALAGALNRFYTKIESNQFSKEVNFRSKAIEIINHASKKQCKAHLQILKLYFADTLTKVQQSLTTPPMLMTSGQENAITKNLNEHLQSMIFTIVEKTKGVLQDLLAFINAENNFAKKVQFRESFCIDNVREGLIVCFLQHITASVRNVCVDDNEDEGAGSAGCSGNTSSATAVATANDSDLDVDLHPRLPPPTLFLLLSKFCLDFRNRSVHFLLAETDDVFHINHKRNGNALTNEMVISNSMHETAQYLLNYYVNIQGNSCSEMLIKSIETRDWLHTIEPRTVRAVMKRVVEDISAIDATVALLYDDQTAAGGGGNNSSDSSKRTTATQLLIAKHQFKSNWSSYTSQTNQLDSSLVSNMHKLFSERIDIFSPVGFSKISILTGIIKISLKSFMECVRLQTFSKYGLQQIQVDTHYLQLYLWRFVADENLVHFLLDEILGSAVHRCLEPVLMEPSVVDVICERG